MQSVVTERPSSRKVESPLLADQRRMLRGSPPQRTRGEIEAAVCEGIRRFALEYLGRGPKQMHAYLMENLLLVPLTDVLTVAEQHLAALPTETGGDLIKQMRSQFVESARPALEVMVTVISGEKVLCLHHDISTSSGDEIMLFTLANPPRLREPK